MNSQVAVWYHHYRQRMRLRLSKGLLCPGHRRQPPSPLLWNRSQRIQGLHSYSCGMFMLPLVLPQLYRCLNQWELLDENPCWLSHSQTGSTVFVGTNDQARGTTNGNQTLCQLLMDRTNQNVPCSTLITWICNFLTERWKYVYIHGRGSSASALRLRYTTKLCPLTFAVYIVSQWLCSSPG